MNKGREPCPVWYPKDPIMVNARIRTCKISQHEQCRNCGTFMRTEQGMRDAPRCWVNTVDWVMLKTWADGRGENFTTAIAKCQRSQGIWTPHNTTLMVQRGALRDENSPTGCKELRDKSSFHNMLISIEEKLWVNTTSTSENIVGKIIGAQCRFLLGSN